MNQNRHQVWLMLMMMLCVALFSLNVHAQEHATPNPAAAAACAANFAITETTLRTKLASMNAIKAAAFASTAEGAHQLLRWRLLHQLGPEGRDATDRITTMEWILGDADALRLLLSAGEPSGNDWNAALDILHRIVTQHPTARSGLTLRIAIATALTHAEPVKWMADGSVIDPVERFAAFVRWDKEGVLFPSFRKLNAWELRYVVGSWSSNEDLVWAREHIKPELRNPEKVGDAAHMLAYNDQNKNGVSVQAGAAFYDHKPMTLALMLEYGGVCGAIGRFGTSMSQAFGVPAMPVGQPGHCALLWHNPERRWVIGNAVSGWDETTCHGGITIPFGGSAWFVPLMQQAQSDEVGFSASETLRAAATLAEGELRSALLAAACKRSPQNFAAWQKRMQALAKAPHEAWAALELEARTAFDQHPMAYDLVVAAAEPTLLSTAPIPKNIEAHSRIIVHALAGMAEHGADGGLVYGALLKHQLRVFLILAPKNAKAVAALLNGDDGRQQTMPPDVVERVLSHRFDACAALDMGDKTKTHGIVMRVLQNLIRGIAYQPAAHPLGLKLLEELLTSLAKSGRTNDARRLADLLCKVAKEVSDVALLERASKLRASLK
ncbi:MAG: hypothetical protein EXS14_07040 [Planctomycetes bacterium]|nr:hypothetical protein [Planctomycetota bacterium]